MQSQQPTKRASHPAAGQVPRAHDPPKHERKISKTAKRENKAAHRSNAFHLPIRPKPAIVPDMTEAEQDSVCGQYLRGWLKDLETVCVEKNLNTNVVTSANAHKKWKHEPATTSKLEPLGRRVASPACGACVVAQMDCDGQSPCSYCTTSGTECIHVENRLRIPTLHYQPNVDNKFKHARYKKFKEIPDAPDHVAYVLWEKCYNSANSRVYRAYNGRGRGRILHTGDFRRHGTTRLLGLDVLQERREKEARLAEGDEIELRREKKRVARQQHRARRLHAEEERPVAARRKSITRPEVQIVVGKKGGREPLAGLASRVVDRDVIGRTPGVGTAGDAEGA